jgi:signal transduction histidine kinase
MKRPLFKRVGVPAVVLAACLVSTAALTWHTGRSVMALERERFTSAAVNTTDRIAARIDIYLALLRGARALFASQSDKVDLKEFANYVQSLRVRERYPGIQAIGFTRREGPEEYRVVHIEPLDARNMAALGADPFGEPRRREAMEKARDGGSAVMSAAITLKQEIDEHKQKGFIIYAPVYRGGRVPPTVTERRAQLQGFVYAAFRAGDLFSGIFGRDTSPDVALRIVDQGDSLFSTPTTHKTRLMHTERLEIADHAWTLEMWPSHPEAFTASSERTLVVVIGLLGFLISIAIFLISRYQVRARGAAEHEELRTREEVRVSETLRRVGTSLAAELERDKLVQLVTDEATALTGAQVGRFEFGPPPDAPPPPFDNLSSYLAVPVVSRQGEVLGGLYFGHSAKGHFTAQHERLLSGIAAQAAIALDNARLYTEVRDADRRKDEFLALLAHELRNPLAPVLTAVHLMEQKAPAGSLARERDVVTRQVRHMSRMIDDLLDLSRISRGKIDLKKDTVDMVAATSAALDIARPLAEQRRHRLVHLAPAGPIWVQGDPLRIEQILTNLMTNAVKYTDPGGTITLALRTADSAVQVAVRDTGIGIAPSELSRIFEPFVQGDRKLDRAQGGLGIGLSLVKSLTEMQGGSVAVSSDGKGKGAEFIVSLPLAGELAVPHPVAREPSRPMVASDGDHATRVLVVDDNIEAAELLTDVLRDCGHRVEMAHDGRAALELAERFHPELVLLDIGLPEIDGYEVARRLREQAGHKNVVLVALTGYGQASDRKKSADAGFDRHLVKPVDADTIISIVQHLHE